MLMLNKNVLVAVAFLILEACPTFGDVIFSRNHATGEVSSIEDDPSQRKMVKELEIMLSNDRSVEVHSEQFSRGSYIFVDEKTCYALRNGRYVKDYSVSDDRTTIAFLVYRGSSRSAAGWYSSLVIVNYDSEGASGVASIRDVLSAEYLESLSSRRMEIISLGSVDEYPSMNVEMLIQERETTPSRMLYNWQNWDIEKEQLVDFSERISGPNGEPVLSDPEWTPDELQGHSD